VTLNKAWILSPVREFYTLLRNKCCVQWNRWAIDQFNIDHIKISWRFIENILFFKFCSFCKKAKEKFSSKAFFNECFALVTVCFYLASIFNTHRIKEWMQKFTNIFPSPKQPINVASGYSILGLMFVPCTAT
jgi:hypothetical protein